MPAATVRASCPAPEIWKKIFCWCLSRISRSSIRRERYISRYISTSCWRVRPSYIFSAFPGFAGGSATAEAFFFDSAFVTAMTLLHCTGWGWLGRLQVPLILNPPRGPGYTENNDPEESRHSQPQCQAAGL